MSPSDKPKRKRNERADKTKSQFYVDLTDGNISGEPSLAPNVEGQVVCVDSDPSPSVIQSVLPSGASSTGAVVGESPQELSEKYKGQTPSFDIREGEIKTPEDKASDIQEEKKISRREGPRRPLSPPPPVPVPAPAPAPAPDVPFQRGVAGRTSKSHTQLGVLVIPGTLRESRIYREKVSSHQGRRTMGNTHSSDNIEDDDEDSSMSSDSSSSSSSSCEVRGTDANPIMQQQYSSVLTQLCDYLYSTPILPSTHHHYHPHLTNHNYVNKKRPPIQPKPKNIPPPKFPIKGTERLRGTPKHSPNGITPEKTTPVKGVCSDTPKIIISDDSQTSEVGLDSTENHSDLSLRDMGAPVNLMGNQSSRETSDTSSNKIDSDPTPREIVQEPEQVYRVNNILEADVTKRTLIEESVDFVPLSKTNDTPCDISDIESQTLPSEPFHNNNDDDDDDSNNNNRTSTTSSMSVVDSSDTNNPPKIENEVPPPSISPEITPKASPDLISQEKRDKKIFNIAKELMTSERVFVDVLRLLNVDFRNFIYDHMGEHLIRIPPSGQPGLFPSNNNNNNYRVNKSNPLASTMHEDDLNKILKYLPQLQNLNELILKDLEGRITDWEGHRRKISDVIVRTGPFLKLYSAYIKEFQSQCDYLEECCQRYPHFAKCLKDFELSERCAKLSIRHYMLKPVQRIPQYRLLLEDYLKHLPDDSPDYVDTQTALVVVSNVASHANDAMKQGTNFMKLLALQDRLTRSQNSSDSVVSPTNGVSSPAANTTSTGSNTHYELIRPGRSLLKEGELLKLCRRGMQPRYYILLSDVLLYTSFITSGPGGALRVNYELPLEGMKVETPKAEDFKNEFSVISTSRSFTLQAKSAEERDEWIQALRDAIEDNASRRSTFLRAKIPTFQHPNTSMLGKQAPVWIPDDRVTMCQQCTAEFTLTFRRHHCRACGKVVCDHCSANRAPLYYKKNQSLRVCDSCFEILQMEFERRYEGMETTSENPQESELRRKSSLKGLFKKGVKEKNHNRKRVPDRLLEVSASDTASQMCGYLRVMVRRSMRRGWFVLKDRVLYEYRAPQDVCALQSLPVLGYEVEAMDKINDVSDGVDNCLAFQLTHPNRPPIVFHTDSPHLAEKWIQAMREAVVLS